MSNMKEIPMHEEIERIAKSRNKDYYLMREYELAVLADDVDEAKLEPTKARLKKKKWENVGGLIVINVVSLLILHFWVEWERDAIVRVVVGMPVIMFVLYVWPLLKIVKFENLLKEKKVGKEKEDG